MIPVLTTALLIENCYSSFYRFHSLIKKRKKKTTTNQGTMFKGSKGILGP